MKHLTRSLLSDIIIFLLVALFIYAAINKLLVYNEFQATLGKSPLIMNHAHLLAIAVPLIEIVCAAMLVLSRTRLAGLYLAFSIMVMFSLYITFILLFSPYVPCSCGGILNKMGWGEHLLFNVIYTLIAVTGIIIYSPPTEHSQINTAL